MDKLSNTRWISTEVLHLLNSADLLFVLPNIYMHFNKDIFNMVMNMFPKLPLSMWISKLDCKVKLLQFSTECSFTVWVLQKNHCKGNKGVLHNVNTISQVSSLKFDPETVWKLFDIFWNQVIYKSKPEKCA